MVHRDGIVDQRYVQRTQYHGYTPDDIVAIGRRIGLTSEYLYSAITTLVIVGTCLLDSIWEKLDRESKADRGDEIFSIISDAMFIPDWRIIMALSKYMMDRSCASENMRMVCQVNYWLASTTAADGRNA
jgi:hypothetical protein